MQDDQECESSENVDMYMHFNLVLSDVSAFLVDGDYYWSQIHLNKSTGASFLPVVDKCGVIIKLEQVHF